MPKLTSNATIRVKGEDGRFTEVNVNTKTENVTTESDIKVMLPPGKLLGGFQENEVIPAGTSVDAILKKLLQVQIPPVYEEPTILATGTNTGSWEAGTTVTVAIASVFTQNDAGDIAYHKIYKDSEEIPTSTVSTPHANHTELLQIKDGTYTYATKCTYLDGPVKDDNFGNPYHQTSIKGKSIKSENLEYTGYRQSFFGVNTTGDILETSDDVRELSGTGRKQCVEGEQILLRMPVGSRAAFVCYPATIRDLSIATYRESGTDNVTAQFTKLGNIDVNGAEGYVSIPYKVYALVLDQPISAPVTFDIVI